MAADGGYRGGQGLRRLLWTSAPEAADMLRRIDVDPYGIEAMLPKMVNMNILVPGLPCKAANIIKQEMLAIGGDAAVARGSVACAVEKTDLILIGTAKQIRRFIEKISFQPFGLANLAGSLRELLDNLSVDHWTIETGRRRLILGRETRIMGILNVTPDSFSDGGRFASPDRALEGGLRLVEEGADILDIGGESTRPGAGPVSLEEELQRTIPVIKSLSGRIDIPISIDTTKSVVAREAIAAGAEIINDISAMRFDRRMPAVMAESGAAVVLMHMRGTPRTMQEGDLHYASLQGDLIAFFRERLEAARAEGISSDRIIIDPGIGFGKTRDDSLSLLKYLPEYRVLGRPILTGPSRKSFLAQTERREASERLEETAAAVAAAVMKGSQIVRVHDVRAMKRAAAVADAIAGAQA